MSPRGLPAERRRNTMSSNRATAQAAVERAIFERFARDAHLVVRADSITQPDPPDILCAVEGLGQVAFELVQLDNAEELQRMGYLHRAPEFWSDAVQALGAEALERHRGAQINVEFHPKANQTQRRAALEQIAFALSKLPEDAEGTLFETLPRGLTSAELKHFPMTDGPLIFEVSGFQVSAPEEPGDGPVGIHLSRIDDKIAHYREGWGVRTELLAYARWGMPFSDQMHRAPEFLAARFPGGIFARGWIYELTSHDIVACVPAMRGP
jgi:hypothetical protein